MTFLTYFIVVGIQVSFILIGCALPALPIRRRYWLRRGGVEKTRETTMISAALQWHGGGGGGGDCGFSYLLESHMAYLASSHILRIWPGIRTKCSRHGFLHQRMNTNGSDTK
jgi:hypothetical protein